MPSVVDILVERGLTARLRQVRATEGLDDQAKAILTRLAECTDAIEEVHTRMERLGDPTAGFVKFAADEAARCFDSAFGALREEGLI